MLGNPPPAALAPARVELHWAAQVPAGAARALVPAASDDSHTSLEWLPGLEAFAGARTPSGLRAALRPADLTLLALDGRAPAATLALAGQTPAQAFAWMAAALRAPAATVLAPPPYEMPDHAVARGGVFRGDDRAALAELGRWYATADTTLRALAGATPGASPVRCWPHHFDIATLLPGTPAVGVGLSPGDDSYAEPYWYVTPWPRPERPARPALPGGAHWHDKGWFGAVLTASAALSGGDPSTFISAAVAAVRGAPIA